MVTLTPIGDFQNNLEVKNGEIAAAAVLNRAVHETQSELIALWNFVTADNPGIEETTNLIDDTIGYSSNHQVRSIAGLHAETFNGGTWS